MFFPRVHSKSHHKNGQNILTGWQLEFLGGFQWEKNTKYIFSLQNQQISFSFSLKLSERKKTSFQNTLPGTPFDFANDLGRPFPNQHFAIGFNTVSNVHVHGLHGMEVVHSNVQCKRSATCRALVLCATTPYNTHDGWLHCSMSRSTGHCPVRTLLAPLC